MCSTAHLRANSLKQTRSLWWSCVCSLRGTSRKHLAMAKGPWLTVVAIPPCSRIWSSLVSGGRAIRQFLRDIIFSCIPMMATCSGFISTCMERWREGGREGERERGEEKAGLNYKCFAWFVRTYSLLWSSYGLKTTIKRPHDKTTKFSLKNISTISR